MSRSWPACSWIERNGGFYHFEGFVRDDWQALSDHDGRVPTAKLRRKIDVGAALPAWRRLWNAVETPFDPEVYDTSAGEAQRQPSRPPSKCQR